MESIVRKLFEFSSLLWGIGFLMPLTAQILVATGWAGPLQQATGMTPLLAGFIIGGLWGLSAQIRGTWFW